MSASNEQSQQAIAIRRFCMQNLLRELLENEGQACAGLLAKRGSIVEKEQHVTQNMLDGRPDMIRFIQTSSKNMMQETLEICGIYYSADVSAVQIERLSHAYQHALARIPAYHLLLDPDQPGRIDALLYRDAAHLKPIEITMVEAEPNI